MNPDTPVISWALADWSPMNIGPISSEDDSVSNLSDEELEMVESMIHSCISEQERIDYSFLKTMTSNDDNSKSTLKVRTSAPEAIAPKTPWKQALEFGPAITDATTCRGANTSTDSASGSSNSSSQEGSPTSVLKQAGTKAWELLYAAAGKVEKMNSEKKVTLDTQEPTFGLSLAASMGLTAGAAAAPVITLRQNSVPGLKTPMKNAQNALKAVNVSEKAQVTPPAKSSQPQELKKTFPLSGASSLEFPALLPTPSKKVLTPSSLPALLQTPLYSSTSCSSTSSSPLSKQDHPTAKKHCPETIESVIQPPTAVKTHLNFTPQKAPSPSRTIPSNACNPALRRPSPDKVMHAVLLGSGKEPGTGVFLPRNMPSSASSSSGHSTSVILPARVVQSLGLQLGPENSVVMGDNDNYFRHAGHGRSHSARGRVDHRQKQQQFRGKRGFEQRQNRQNGVQQHCRTNNKDQSVEVICDYPNLPEEWVY